MQKQPLSNSDSEQANNDTQSARLTELEIKSAYQQETLESLSNEVSKQWTVIDQLTRKMGMMAEQIYSSTHDGGKAQDDPPPPHY